MSQEFNGITYTSSIDCLRAQVEYWKERAEKAELELDNCQKHQLYDVDGWADNWIYALFNKERSK